LFVFAKSIGFTEAIGIQRTEEHDVDEVARV
jgi:hypothetical protein